MFPSSGTGDRCDPRFVGSKTADQWAGLHPRVDPLSLRLQIEQLPDEHELWVLLPMENDVSVETEVVWMRWTTIRASIDYMINPPNPAWYIYDVQTRRKE